MTQLIAGLAEASVLFLVATGLTLVFGAARIINVSHGSFYMYSAFMVTSLTFSGVNFWWGSVLGVLAMALLGIVIEVAIIRRLYDKDHLTQLVATLAVLYILSGLALRLWGWNPRTVNMPSGLTGHVVINGEATPVYLLFVIGVAVVVGILLWFVLERSKAGWRVQAAVEDPETLAVSGTNVRLVYTGVFAASAALAGLAGAIVAPLTSVSPGLDASMLVQAFIVAAVGGLGSVSGAALGAMIIALFNYVSVAWLPDLGSAGLYIALVLVLALRPKGLLGVDAEIGR